MFTEENEVSNRITCLLLKSIFLCPRSDPLVNIYLFIFYHEHTKILALVTETKNT